MQGADVVRQVAAQGSVDGDRDPHVVAELERDR
jgi:hypothetical protein